MPLRATAANIERAIRNLLDTETGESLLEYFGLRGRVVALTDRRFILGTLPVFGASRALIDAPIASIEAFDVEADRRAVTLAVTVEGETYREKLSSLLHDVGELIRPVVERLLELNPSVGSAPYFADGEREAGTLMTTDGVLRVSDRAVYLVTQLPGGQNEVVARWPHEDVTLFDWYRAGDAGRVVVEAAGELRVLEVVPSGVLSAPTPGVYDEAWAPVRMARAIGFGARPRYLLPKERLRYSVRAARTKPEVGRPNLWARVTNRRVLLLQDAGNETLELDSEVTLDQVTGFVVTRHMGDRGQLRCFEARFEGARPFTLWIPSSSSGAFEPMAKALRKRYSPKES